MNKYYKGKLFHYVDVKSQVQLPIYSERYHNIEGEWTSVDDIDEKNICYKRFSINTIRRFITPKQNNERFKSEYCLVELFNGEIYPIHGSRDEWEKQYDEWKDINKVLFGKLYEKLDQLIKE